MKKMILACLIALAVVSCSDKPKSGLPLYSASDYDTIVKGKQISLYTLANANGMTAQITNYGCNIVDLWVPAKDGTFKDVVLGYPSIKDFFNPQNTFGGYVVGRYANRIAKGKFTIDGKEYNIPINNGENALHGGLENFSQKVWDARQFKNEAGEDALELTYVSVDGEEGFPGTLTVKVTYTVTNDNKLRIAYNATTDAPTVINLTNHAYFNLHGDRKQSVNSHLIKINADNYTPTDAGLIPTGEIVSVAGTALDLRTATPIGDVVFKEDSIFNYRDGYDHNYIINRPEANAEEVVAAEAYEPSTGILMTVQTTTPGIQFFTGKSRVEQDTASQYYGSAIALEAQNYPDAPNHDNFPSAVLRPGETYTQITTYGFSVK